MKTTVKSPAPRGTRRSKKSPAGPLRFILRECEEGGYTAICPDIPGAISEGETQQEAMENLADAMRCVLEVSQELMIERLSAYSSYSTGCSGDVKPRVERRETR